MKRIYLILSVLLAGAILWVYSTDQGTVMESLTVKDEAVIQDVSFTTIPINSAPKALQGLAARNREKESASGVFEGGSAYILVTRGVKPTAGYSVAISTVTLETIERKPIVIVNLKYTDPQPGEMTAQVLTYPMVAARLNLQSIPQGLSFIFHKNK